MTRKLFPLLPLLATVLAAQSSSPLTLTNTARIVLLDVVVTGRDGKPVPNLDIRSFHLLDNGQPQTLRSVDEHTFPAAPVKTATTVPLPPGTFTDQTEIPPFTPLNVILIDNLNTPLTDQAYLRTQLLKYLEAANPQARIAVFTLNSRLAMVQAFTSDPRVLRQAILTGGPLRSVLLTDAQQHDTVRPTIQERSQELGFGDHPNARVAESIARQLNFENQEEAQLALDRARITLNGLDLLGHYLAGFPGRKNLVWFSGSFPVDLAPRARTSDTETLARQPGLAHAIDPFVGSFSVEGQFRKTADLLANNQVAVYPVDDRGLLASPEYTATNRIYRDDPDAKVEFASDLAEEHSTMLRIAADTGGRAFLNNNDFTRALGQALQDSSDFYTLAYTPLQSTQRRKLSQAPSPTP